MNHHDRQGKESKYMLDLTAQRRALYTILAGQSHGPKATDSKLAEPIEGQDNLEVASEFHEKHIVVVRLDYDRFVMLCALAADGKLRAGRETYTCCSDCGGTISDERLLVNPWACFCTTCQELQEGSEAPVATTIEEFV